MIVKFPNKLMHVAIQDQELVASQIGVCLVCPSLKYRGDRQRRLVALKKMVVFGMLPVSKSIFFKEIFEVISPQSTAIIIGKPVCKIKKLLNLVGNEIMFKEKVAYPGRFGSQWRS